MKKLSPGEIQLLQDTLKAARGGRATLTQAATAHDLAQAAELVHCSAELRAHIRELAADHSEPKRKAGRDVFTGVVSGVMTHVLLGELL
jgi:hypothetical protein